MNPDFSIIIPCYKASSTIARVLSSILDQDYKNFEIICVLDGPDEDTERIIKAFPTVRYEVLEKNMGAPSARNHGFRMSKGRYILFSDADVKWNPGMFRKFKETFEKNPDIDFCYGGFRWINSNDAHVPYEFDPYLLTVSNYIDTGNPLKREWVEKIGGWDESLKRWQDWDFWLRIVKAGAKGLKIDEITRETELPKPGNISSQNNFEETYQIVRKKHGIKDREICLTTIAAHGHALRVAKALGWDYWPRPDMLPNDYKAIYLLGMFPESVQDHVSLFLDRRTGMKPRDCKYFIHWIGTDVLHMRTMMPFIQAKNLRLMFEKYNVTHVFQSQQLKEEMEELGFKGEVIHLPIDATEFERSPTPKEFTVACYDHDGIDQKWHKWLAMELTKAMPDIKWIFFGNKYAVGKEGNTEFLGRVPIKSVIEKSSMLFRFTVHDGYPVAPVEFLLSGKPVLTNVPSMLYTNYLDLGIVADDKLASIKKRVYDAIRHIQKCKPFSPAEYQRIRTHYESLMEPKSFAKKIERLIDGKKTKKS